MTKLTIAELSKLTDRSEDVIHNWLARLDLTTKYQRAKAGPAREGRFTKMNAMEMVLISRLVEAGMAPGPAAERVRRLFAQLKDAKPDGYVMFYGDSLACSDEPPSERLVNFLQNTGQVVFVVPLTKFAAEIEEFFARVAEDEDEEE
jgi:hypothetical protein